MNGGEQPASLGVYLLAGWKVGSACFMFMISIVAPLAGNCRHFGPVLKRYWG
jgi:hypothetical protein